MEGLTIVHTGNGKGKTTAALGLALRAVGWGKRVLIIQFLKTRVSGEIKALQKIQEKLEIGNWKLEIEQYGTREFVDPKKLRPVDFKEAHRALKSAMLHVSSSMFNVVILDEINVAIKFGLVRLKEVLDLIKSKPAEVDLVLTGRGAPKEILKVSDLVTEFVEIKHPYKMGKKAKQGVDY
ncbi:cob(I)yrinic acid a,c-diamide adenosyltransferase [Candidatus Gottesmanbacteria bacterium]|nr:cob(I)yrinic acid a,c-diamide adenosyltransferase [Candidatus Gottesmanbacteria bacterium]